MLTISENNRVELENEYLSLLLNKQELMDIVQVKPHYLKSPQNQNMLEYMIECYQTIGSIKAVEMAKKHKDFNNNHFVDLLCNTLLIPSLWKEQIKLSEECIVKYYKEDIIKILNERLNKSEIDYDDFIKQLKKLDDVQLIENMTTLTEREILENINTDNVAINLNKFDKFNNKLKLVQGDFLIIGATTGAGKSGFMLNLMNDLMTAYQCIYFNMEMSKSTIYKRLISINSNIPVDYVTKPSDYQKGLIDSSLKKIENAKMIIEHKANDIKQIKSIVTKLKDKNRHTVLFVDHLGLTKCDDKKNLYEQATEVAKQLRQICLEYDCTIISASQLNRTAYNASNIDLNMLKDSGELENSASKVVLLYKDEKSNAKDLEVLMNIHIAKNRDGLTGIIKMNYDKAKQIFKEVIDYAND